MNRSRQEGVTLTGMMIFCVLLALVLMLCFKVFPAYLEHHTIERNFKSMAADPTLANVRPAEMQRNWVARTSVDNVKSLPAENIDFSRDTAGWNITADYSVKVPLFQNVSLLIDFHASSR